ncbi:hypothetical protein CHH48_16530, partial [Terribacillus saccharophilus]
MHPKDSLPKKLFKENNQALMKARDADEKAAVALESVVESILKELETMQTRLFEKAKALKSLA